MAAEVKRCADGPLTRSKAAKRNIRPPLPRDLETADICERGRKGLLRKCPTNGDHSAATLPKGTFECMDECGRRKYWCVRGEEWPSERTSDFSKEEFDEVTELRKIYDGPGVKFAYWVHPSICDCEVVDFLRYFYSTVMRGYKDEQPNLTYKRQVELGYVTGEQHSTTLV